MARKILDRAFAVAIIVLLLVFFVEAYLTPVEIIRNENRSAEQFSMPELAELLDGSYQAQLEKVVADQFVGSEKIKKEYNTATERLGFVIMEPVLEQNPNRYIHYGGKKTIAVFGGDWLLYVPTKLSGNTDTIDQLIDNYNEAAKALEEQIGAEFYVYYVETSGDYDFENGENTGRYEYIAERLELPEGHLARSEITSFEDYCERFYRTDHHWNHVGSYLGYTQIAEMLGIPEEQWLRPLETVKLRDALGGSLAMVICSQLFKEPFYVYRFDFSEMDIKVNEKDSEDYGQQEAFWNGTTDSPASYGQYYGWDYARVLLETENTEAKNILVIGTSFDNAVIKLLASHFYQTHSIDMRYYEDTFGQPLNVVEYVQEHDIDIVLVAGAHGVFSNKDYLLET